MEKWSDFFVATTGAAAALTGLIFVGVSISLAKILATRALPERALLSLLLLLTILILSVLFLVPGQSFRALGIEVLVTGCTVWLAVLRIDHIIFRSKEKKYQQHYVINILINQVAVIPYFIGGITMLISGEKGLYWIVAAIIFSFIKAVVDAWVLLVEINR